MTWEHIDEGIERLAVPGGHLYRTYGIEARDQSIPVALAFVPAVPAPMAWQHDVIAFLLDVREEHAPQGYPGEMTSRIHTQAQALIDRFNSHQK